MINNSLNGASSGSTTQSRVGIPTVNNIGSNLSAIIGGPGSNLASQLGDPVRGISGLSSLIKASSVRSSSSIFSTTALNNFRNANTLYDQHQCFLALFNSNNLLLSINTLLFSLTTPPTSLADIVNGITKLL